MQYQGIDDQRIVNIGLQPIAKDLGLPLVVTNDVHYLKNSDYKPHDVLLCIGTGKSVNDAERLRYHGDQFYLKTAEEMAQVFQDFPEALQNTVRIAESLQRRSVGHGAQPAELRRAGRLHARRVFRARRPRRLQGAAPAAQGSRGAGRPASTRSTSTSAGWTTKST